VFWGFRFAGAGCGESGPCTFGFGEVEVVRVDFAGESDAAGVGVRGGRVALCIFGKSGE
jgi:hypothetical protein